MLNQTSNGCCSTTVLQSHYIHIGRQAMQTVLKAFKYGFYKVNTLHVFQRKGILLSLMAKI